MNICRLIFSLTVALGIAAIAHAADVPPQTPLPFPSFGVSLAAPAGWSQIPEGNAGRITRFAISDAKSNAITALLAAEVEPLNKRTLTEFRDGLIKLGGPFGSEKATKLGDIDATHVRFASNKKELHPAAVIFAQKSDYVYLLSAFEMEPDAVSAALEGMRASWKFIELEPPAKHLKFRSASFPVFNQFQMNVPAIMRPYDVDDKNSEMRLGIYNYARHDNELFIHIAIIALPAGSDIAQIRANFPMTVARKFGWRGKLTWKEIPGQPARWVLDPMEAAAGALGPNIPAMTVRHILVSVDAKTAALFSINIAALNEEDKKTYNAMIEDVAKSIETIPQKR